MDFKTFLNVVPHVISNKNPVLIRGRHGVGKSEVVAMIAATLGLDLVMRRASQMTEGDLLGLPSIEGNQTVWNPPDWFKTATERAVVLFLDEVDRAQQEVRQGIFELTDSRSIAGHKLHPGTVIFAAVNGGEHGGQYSVFEMDPAELDRYTTFDVEPTVEDWIAWASTDGSVNELVVEFIRDNHMHLEHKGDFDPNKVYPSRRSWKRFSDCCNKAGLFDGAVNGDAGATPAIFQLSTGYLGLEAAVGFQDFLKEGIQITVEDLLNGKITEKRMKRMNQAQHNALLDRLDQSEVMKTNLPDKQIFNIAEYVIKLPSELFMRAFHSFGGHKNDHNIVRLMKTVVDGFPFSAYMIHVTAGTPMDESARVDSPAPAADVAESTEEPAKKKRGRPRKVAI